MISRSPNGVASTKSIAWPLLCCVPARRPPTPVGAAAALAALGAGAQVLAGFNGHVSAWQWFWLVVAVLGSAGCVCLTSGTKKHSESEAANDLLRTVGFNWKVAIRQWFWLAAAAALTCGDRTLSPICFQKKTLLWWEPERRFNA